MKVETITQGLMPLTKPEKKESSHSVSKLFGTDAVVFDENKQKEQKNGYQEFFEKKKKKNSLLHEDEITQPLEELLKPHSV